MSQTSTVRKYSLRSPGKQFNFNTVLLEYSNQIIDKNEEKYWTNATALHNATYQVGNIRQAIIYFSLVGAAV